jgi:hypothetical protein
VDSGPLLPDFLVGLFPTFVGPERATFSHGRVVTASGLTSNLRLKETWFHQRGLLLLARFPTKMLMLGIQRVKSSCMLCSSSSVLLSVGRSLGVVARANSPGLKAPYTGCALSMRGLQIFYHQSIARSGNELIQDRV